MQHAKTSIQSCSGAGPDQVSDQREEKEKNQTRLGQHEEEIPKRQTMKTEEAGSKKGNCNLENHV